MLNIDTIFDDKNKDALARLEANSANLPARSGESLNLNPAPGDSGFPEFPTNQNYPGNPFGKESLFNQSDWKRRLEEWLSEQKVTEFVYSNTSTFDGIPVIIRIHGILVNGSLQVLINTKPNYFVPKGVADIYAFVNKGIDFIANTKELNYLNNSTHFLIYKLSDKWNLCDKYIDATFVSRFAEGLTSGNRELSDAEYQQIYNEFQDCKSRKSDDLKNKFNKFCQDINKRLAKSFYSDADLAAYVKLVDQAGKTIAENTLKTNYKKKENDIKLNITLHSDGRIEIKHEFNPNYLKAYEEKWIKEAKARGMEVDIAAMRQDIISFLNSEEAELSFGKEFLRKIRTWYDSNVGEYIEAIQATQKVIGNVWREGTINQSTWYSKDDEHKEWPKYMHFNPVVGGVTDGVIDEIVGLPMACKSVYQLATDSEKRKALGKVFTSEGFSQMMDGLKQEALEVANDEDKLGHFSGQTTISVISMLSGVGIISKAGKVGEMVEMGEKVAKKVDDIPDPHFHRINDLLKKAKRTVADEKILKELIEEVGEDVMKEAAPELLDLAKGALKKKRKFDWEEVKAFFKRGNDYNKKVRDKVPPKYDFHEVTVEVTLPDGKIKKYRLDSYNEGTEIVSRKATDFDNIELSTFEGYLKEMKVKYAEGSKITAPKYEDLLKGKVLKGKLKLEVPKTNELSSRVKEFKELAEKKYGIEIVFEPE
jgi:hypothetical protein